MPPPSGNHHSVKHHAMEDYYNDQRNRTRHRHLTERHRRRKHRHPEVRANSDVMGEAAYERHQKTMVNLTGKPEDMSNYAPGGKQYGKKPAQKFEMDSESEDEFGGGRRRRRTRRHRRHRRHTRKH